MKKNIQNKYEIFKIKFIILIINKNNNYIIINVFNIFLYEFQKIITVLSFILKKFDIIFQNVYLYSVIITNIINLK